MSAYIRLIYDRIEFIEFKQNILFLKQPQHKASVFYDLSLEDFINIRNFTNEFEKKLLLGESLSILDYEKGLFDTWFPIRSYPASSTLVAKSLMSEDGFNSLFKSSN